MQQLQQSVRQQIQYPVILAAIGITLCGQAQAYPQGGHPVPKEFNYYQASKQGNPKNLAAQVQALQAELRQTREQLDSRIQRLEQTLQMGNITPAANPAALAVSTPQKSVKGKSSLTVCHKGCDFIDLQKAVDAANPGAVIKVAAELNGTCAIINKPIHLIGKQGKDGQRAHLVGGVCNGKAPLVTAAANIIIEGFEISGITVPDGNGACIRLDPNTSDLTVRNINCHNSQDGILGESKGHFLIEDSSFVANGFGNGQAHALYIWGDDILIRRCQMLSTQNAGHSLKSGARKLTVENSILAALSGHNSRALDAYGGGEIVLTHNVIQQGPQSDNSDVIGLAFEPARLLPEGHSLKMEHNWVIFDDPGRGLLTQGQKLGPILVTNNSFVGLKGMGLEGIEDVGNQWFDSREKAGLPAFDGTIASLPKVASKK